MIGMHNDVAFLGAVCEGMEVIEPAHSVFCWM